jgi:hypothetical protein
MGSLFWTRGLTVINNVRIHKLVKLIFPLFLVVSGGCGGAKSEAGTSASNCLMALEQALRSAPSSYVFRGLSQIGYREAGSLGFFGRRGHNYCLVILRKSNGHHGSATYLEILYSEPGQRKIARRLVHRAPGSDLF